MCVKQQVHTNLKDGVSGEWRIQNGLYTGVHFVVPKHGNFMELKACISQEFRAPQ